MPILPHLPPQGHSQDSASNHSPMSEVSRKLSCDGRNCESYLRESSRGRLQGGEEGAELRKGMRAVGRGLNGGRVWGSQEELNRPVGVESRAGSPQGEPAGSGMMEESDISPANQSKNKPMNGEEMVLGCCLKPTQGSPPLPQPRSPWMEKCLLLPPPPRTAEPRHSAAHR